MYQRIGFVGVGRMGSNMARHLKIDCDYPITAIYDAHKPLAQEVAEELGATAYDSLKEVTANSDIIITVVTNDDAMRDIFFNEEDNLFWDSNGKTFINCATVSPKIHEEIYQAAIPIGACTLEGSMASSISHAREGNLYLMIGGDEGVFDANRQLLGDLSVNLRYCGGAGSAAKVKALVNMVMNMNTCALAEGLGLASALNLNLDMVCEVFSQTGANSRVLETDAEDMLARDHECWFSAEHAAKDSGIARSLAEECGLDFWMNKTAEAMYRRMTDEGLGDLDKSGVAEFTFPGRHAYPEA